MDADEPCAKETCGEDAAVKKQGRNLLNPRSLFRRSPGFKMQMFKWQWAKLNLTLAAEDLEKKKPESERLEPLTPKKMPERERLEPLSPKKMPERERIEAPPYMFLDYEFTDWSEKAVMVLYMIRCRQVTEYDPKIGIFRPTRLSYFNIAFFDHDKESEVEHGSLFRDIPGPKSRLRILDDAVNVISIKIAKSDVSYPINIYGTVLARDQNDYRCVYLFKRGRDNAQPITCPHDMLAVTGPYRALNGQDNMFFEFDLKIKGEGSADQDFCKGYESRNGACDTFEPQTLSLESCLSKVDLLYMPVRSALQASIGVNVLNGKSKFSGKVTAWTSGNERIKIVLYDSEVAGTETKLGNGGSVLLTRHIVAVPCDEHLGLKISICEGNHKPKHLKLDLSHDIEECTKNIGPHKLQVKIIWTRVVRQQRPNMWKHVGNHCVLWE